MASIQQNHTKTLAHQSMTENESHYYQKQQICISVLYFSNALMYYLLSSLMYFYLQLFYYLAANVYRCYLRYFRASSFAIILAFVSLLWSIDQRFGGQFLYLRTERREDQQTIVIQFMITINFEEKCSGRSSEKSKLYLCTHVCKCAYLLATICRFIDSSFYSSFTNRA